VARLLFFGPLSDLAGGRERSHAIPDPGRTLSEVISALAADQTELGEAVQDPSVRYMVNNTLVSDLEIMVQDRDEIGFLPPFSGG